MGSGAEEFNVGSGTFVKRLRWRVGNESSIDIFNDSRILQPSTFYVIYPRVLPVGSKVSDLISPSHSWDEVKIRQSSLSNEAALILFYPL